MDKNDVKRWLRRYKHYINKADGELDEIERQRSRAEKVTASFSLAPGGSGTGDPMANAVTSIVDMQKEAAQYYITARECQQEIRWLIDTVVEDFNQRNVLTYYYIHLYPWEEVAYRLHYSWSGVHKIHKAALEFLVHHWPFPEE